MSNPTKIGGQEPSEPPSAEPPSAETAEEENPAIAAFNSWGGEGSPPPPGFATRAPAGEPTARETSPIPEATYDARSYHSHSSASGSSGFFQQGPY